MSAIHQFTTWAAILGSFRTAMVAPRGTFGYALACALNLGAVACTGGVDPIGIDEGPRSTDGGAFTTVIDAGPPWAPWESLADCLASIGHAIIRDADGDGVPGHWLVGCGTEEQTDTTVSNSEDCDDADPTASKKGFRDADGDQFTTTEIGCFATVPDGYREFLTTDIDCDDSSATIRPYSSAVEQWDDGVDTNCDGRDAPLDCRRTGGDCGCELLGVTSVPVDASCTSSDLFVVAQRSCSPTCQGYNAVTVGNRGALAIAGGFDVELADGPTLHIAEDLAAGAVSHPFLVDGGVLSIRLVTPAAQCDVQNDQATLPPFYPCERP